jgi:hypothetical protein
MELEIDMRVLLNLASRPPTYAIGKGMRRRHSKYTRSALPRITRD